MRVRAHPVRQPAKGSCPVAVAVAVTTAVLVMSVAVLMMRAAARAHAIQHDPKSPLQHINDNYPHASANRLQPQYGGHAPWGAR